MTMKMLVPCRSYTLPLETAQWLKALGAGGRRP